MRPDYAEQLDHRPMLYAAAKVAITALLVVAISEIAKRSSFAGAVLASIPLISVLAMIWLYIDTNEPEKVANLAASVFWLVLPSLVLFITLPLMLRQGINFTLSMSLSITLTVAAYFLMVLIMGKFGIEL